jgi:N-acetylmuramoyl-L-alanine amidase
MRCSSSGVLLKSEMTAAIAETVFITIEAEGRLLSDGAGARQQQIAEPLKVCIEGYFRTS